MRDSDVCTRMATPHDALVGVVAACGVFARAFAFLPRSPRFGRERGYRVLWLEAGELRFRDVVEHPAGYAILGRHSRAHVRLRGDPTLALRHFVLRARRTASGAPALHVADLLSPLPLFVDGSDEPRFSCTLEGAVTARIGGHAICALPFDGCAALPEGGGPGRGDGPDDEDDDEDEPDDVLVGPRLVAPRPVAVAVPRVSACAATMTSRIEDLQPWPHGQSGAGSGGIALELEGALGRAKVWVSEPQLEGLVVLGRYARCRVGANVFSTSVSRMHLAITRSPDGLEVLDLASTQGVRVGGVRAHRAIVGDGSVIRLADGERVRVRVRG